MPVIELVGSGNYVGVTPTAPARLDSGDLTIVALIRKLAGADGALNPVIECYDGTTDFWSWSYASGNQSVFDSAGSDSFGGESFASFVEADGWCMCSLRKTTGTTKPRHQRWRNSDGLTGTEDHPGAALADSGTPGTGMIYRIGELTQYGLAGHLRLAWIALFDGYLSDAQIAECRATRRTSNSWDNSFGHPVLLLEAQSGGLVDVAGTTTAISTVGSVPVITGDDPPGWLLNNIGGPAAPVAAGLPVIVGAPQTGGVLSCTTGTWDPDPDNAPTGYAYQWKRDGTNIGGATTSSLTTVSGDAGHSISCVVTASNDEGSASQTSLAVIPQAPAFQVAMSGLWVEKPTKYADGTWI